MLIFAARHLFSLKHGQRCPKTVFHGFLRQYCFFRKNCWIKDIQLLICDKKGYIHFWCQNDPLQVAQRPSGRAVIKIKVNAYFQVPKYDYSDALFASEIFIIPTWAKNGEIDWGQETWGSKFPPELSYAYGNRRYINLWMNIRAGAGASMTGLVGMAGAAGNGP